MIYHTLGINGLYYNSISGRSQPKYFSVGMNHISKQICEKSVFKEYAKAITEEYLPGKLIQKNRFLPTKILS